MINKIIIIGLGNMGKRHLQAGARLDYIEQIFCYDREPSALASVPAFCLEYGINDKTLSFTSDFIDVLGAITKDSLVIIATTAGGRAEMLGRVIAKTPGAIIAEKPLCQSGEEYEKILTASKARNVPVYLNFTRHAYPFYREIKNALKGAKNRQFKAVFPNGIALIGIHMFDLMTWLFDAKKYSFLDNNLQEQFETKRMGYFDFFGGITLKTGDDDTCVFSAVKGNDLFSIDISSSGKQFVIYESAGKLIASEGMNKIDITEIKTPFTSQVMDKVIDNIARGKAEIGLPDVFESHLAHKILFEYMRVHGLAGINIT